jgi:nitroimidazol reductase NimA-like FMN-containing flavoprotein (pyridoxamine 5'-phosphate oxidase superfamily)
MQTESQAAGYTSLRGVPGKRLTMRMGEMTSKECREILTRTSIGRLGCSHDDQPYVVPIYFVYEPDHLYGFATDGQKIEWMRTNPKVCVESDEITSHFQWTSVILYGRYRELPNLPLYAEERDHARKLLERLSLWWQTAFASRRLKSSGDLIPPLFYSIEIDSMTGYRAVADAGE